MFLNFYPMKKLSVDEIINAKDLKALLRERIEIIQKNNIKRDIENIKPDIRDFRPLSVSDDEDVNENSEFLNELRENYRFSYFEGDARNYFG